MILYLGVDSGVIAPPDSSGQIRKKVLTLSTSETRTAGETTKLVAGKSRKTVRAVAGSSLKIGDVIVTKTTLCREHMKPRLTLLNVTVTNENIVALSRRGRVFIFVC